MWILIRPPGREPYLVSLERLTETIKLARRARMGITRDELKKQRLRAMGVVSEQMQENSDMYTRIMLAGGRVAAERDKAEAAHMGALNEQARDLQEMAEEMAEFAQSVPSTGGGNGTTPPAKTSAQPSAAADALAALNAAQPQPKAETWSSDGETNAYKGTSPPKL